MEEYEYDMECLICEVKVTVVVYDEDERPAFCTMCGEQYFE